jgi:hypothetical protein
MRTLVGAGWLAAWFVVALPGTGLAHCDALDGPVVLAARKALEARDVTAVLWWVQPSNEGEVRDAFNRTLQVRALGGDARSLADRWFFETLVRIHRAGEGAPFDGLKPEGQIDPILSEADRALAGDSMDVLAEHVAGRAVAGMRERFARARESRAKADASVEAGRQFVAAYVDFLHYVEGLRDATTRAAAGHERPGTVGEHAH